MKRTRGMSACLAVFGLSVGGLVGCQTQVTGTGQTLPSPRYLDHLPQYHPQSPPFPLPRELANQERAAAGVGGAAGAGVGGGALPPQVPAAERLADVPPPPPVAPIPPPPVVP